MRTRLYILICSFYTELCLGQVMIKLKKSPVERLGEVDSLTMVIDIINEKNPELVFLDIEIIGGTGFDVSEQSKPYKFSVFFTTAYEKINQKIADLNIACLYKPVDIQMLKKLLR